MTGKRASRLGTSGLLASSIILAGCVENPLKAPRFSEMFARSQPAAALPEPTADSRGVIDFGDFAVIVANDPDSFENMAARVGLTPEILARYNGLPVGYLVRPGERFAIPKGAQVAAVEEGWTPEMVTGALSDVPDGQREVSAPEVAGTVPLRHRVEDGETVYSIADRYDVSVTSLASWNGLTGSLEVRPGRSLIIPVADAPGVTSAGAQPEGIASAPLASEPGTTTDVAPPPSSTEPLPEDQADVTSPQSPNLGEFRTAASGAIKLSAPVQGKIIKPFSQAAGSAKNDGIDFETAKGASVLSAEAGEVALVSRSLGGLGTIVLIRHPDDLITVYGRVTNVLVSKGDPVNRGQAIGSVADGTPPTLHFEVRRGTEAVDPEPFL